MSKAVVGVGIALFAGVASALALADDIPRVLHQDVRSPAKPALPYAASKTHGSPPSEGRNPAAFSRGDKVLPKPSDTGTTERGEPVLGGGGFAADRETEARPDYVTRADDTLRYSSVFNPSVIPFKRMTALDAIRDDYTLYSSRSASRQELRIGGRRRANRDLFWGSLTLELSPGQDVAIPSVAPDMRILSYESTPTVPLSFSRDGNDNFYVRSDETGSGGRYRLVFLADASASYFSPQIPSGYRVRDLARLGGLPERVPARIRTVAQRALARLAVDRNDTLDRAVERLVYYFRSFEAKKSPPATGDIFWDLFLSRAGVCRHRSFAFMVMANTLGIPTRYVTNEAHAWVEIWVPDLAWLRIDLGGAAMELEVGNADEKSIHRPRSEDALPSPPNYQNNYTQLRGQVSGLTDGQLAEAQQPSAPSPDSEADPSGTSDGAGPPIDEQTKPDSEASDTGGDVAEDETLIGPGDALPSLEIDDTDSRIATAIAVLEADEVSFRGQTMRVRGMLTTAAGTPVPGARVDIFVAPAGLGGNGALLVGHSSTSIDGSFVADVDIPLDLELKRYEVYAANPGDARHLPSVSR